MEETKRYSFQKKEKLKGKPLFERLFNEGVHITQFPVKLIYLRHDFPDNSPFKVAVVAPKKRFKTAVQRNRIKRLLREAYRQNKHLLFNNVEGNFAFLFLYLGNTTPKSQEVRRAVVQLLTTFLKKESDEKIDQ